MDQRTCPSCGADFTPAHPRTRYCSRACSKREERRRYRDRHTERAYCKHCGIGFQRVAPRVAGNPKVYCSTNCQYEARSQQYKQRGIKPPLNDRLLGAYYAALRLDPCAYCGATADHIDHITPRNRDGENHWENYTAACASCNATKSDKPLLFFLGWRLAATDFLTWDEAVGNASTRGKSIAAVALRAAAG